MSVLTTFPTWWCVARIFKERWLSPAFKSALIAEHGLHYAQIYFCVKRRFINRRHKKARTRRALI